MYRQAYQRGMLTVFYSVGSKPLAIWDTVTRNGYISRFLDDDIKSMVLEIGGTNVSTTYMICPKGNEVLGISMPFLVMIVKNLRKYFSFEVTVLDETRTRRRFRVSNFQSTTQILPLCTVMPIGLTEGWNQIQFNLADFTRRAYNKQFVEVQKLKINANIRLRRIYFAERILPEDELPAEYKLFFPLKQRLVKDKKTITETKEELIKSPEEEKSTGLEMKKSKSRTFSKDKGSMQVIKPASRQQNIGEKSSQIIEVAEGNFNRTDTTTEVVDITNESSQTNVLEAESKTIEPIKENSVSASQKEVLPAEVGSTQSVKEYSARASQQDVLAAEAGSTESIKEYSASASQKDALAAEARSTEPMKEKSAIGSQKDVLAAKSITTEPIKEKSASAEKVMENQITVEGSDTRDDVTGSYEEEEGDAPTEPAQVIEE